MTRMTDTHDDPSSAPVPLDLTSLATKAREARDAVNELCKVFGQRNAQQVADWAEEILSAAGHGEPNVRKLGNRVHAEYSDAGGALFRAGNALDHLVRTFSKVQQEQQDGPVR